MIRKMIEAMKMKKEAKQLKLIMSAIEEMRSEIAETLMMEYEIPELIREELDIDAESVAYHIDTHDIAYHIDVSDIACEIDHCDIAREMDLDDIVESMDMDNICERIQDNIIDSITDSIDSAEIAAHLDVDEIAKKVDLSGNYAASVTIGEKND